MPSRASGEPAGHSKATPLVELAPAKVNLTLAVTGRRADGYHELDSLVAFAALGDELSLVPGDTLSLAVEGPFASAAGDGEANLVLKAAKALARRAPALKLGAFHLDKRLPVAAGLGGGSADAAAALRLLARLNGLAADSPAVLEAAEEVGSDVPVCLRGGCRSMGGRGEKLGPSLPLPDMAMVLVSPGVGLPTARVFAAFAARPRRSLSYAWPAKEAKRESWLAAIAERDNDLEAPARALEPAIDAAKQLLAEQPGCLLARMTGSGTTVFGLFETARQAETAADAVTERRPGWWVRATRIG